MSIIRGGKTYSTSGLGKNQISTYVPIFHPAQNQFEVCHRPGSQIHWWETKAEYSAQEKLFCQGF